MIRNLTSKAKAGIYLVTVVYSKPEVVSCFIETIRISDLVVLRISASAFLQLIYAGDAEFLEFLNIANSDSIKIIPNISQTFKL